MHPPDPQTEHDEHPAEPARNAKPVFQLYDKAYKLMFGDPVMVREFCEDFVDPEIVAELDFGTLERLPAEFISETWERRSDDIIWRVRFKDGRPCYLVLILEFQKEPDASMPYRILVYSSLLLQALSKTDEVRRHGAPPTLPIVIFIGEETWDADTGIRYMPMSRRLVRFCPRQDFLVLKIRELADAALAGKGIAAQVFRLERSRDIRELREALRDAAQRFHGKRYRNVQRIISDWLKAVVFKRHDITVNVPEEAHNLEGGFTMLEQNVERWIEQYIQQGVAQGEARGIEIGEARGETRGLQIGMAQGGLNMLVSLVHDGLLRIGDAAKKADMSEDEFRAKMREREISAKQDS